MDALFGDVSEAAALFALTFLSEDAAVLSAAVMVGSGMLSWELGFAASFFGIWLGDLWLYGMARAFGGRFVARFAIASAVERSETWFQKRGSLVLVASRFVPGLRLPSYLAAGAMRFPLRTFVVVTGIVAAVWVAAIFVGSNWLGVANVPLIRDYGQSMAIGVLTIAGIAAVARSSVRLLASRGNICARGKKCGDASPVRRPQHARHSLVARWTQWEFWPAWLFYAPVAFFYLWLALRHRSLTLPTAANPGMPMGGLVGESKFDTLRVLQDTCPEAVAQTWLIPPGALNDRFTQVKAPVECGAISLPFILKPDIGQRGVGVRLIHSLAQAREYLATVEAPVLLQRYAPGPREVGVFYYRLSNEPDGRIFAITEKLFPVIEGDGERTLEELIFADQRAAIVAATYLKRFHKQRSRVLARGEILKLVEAGNHAQGCIFRDGMHLNTPELLAAIDRISRSVPGFYIGRFDLRYASNDDLRAGRGFQIVELNGASAEATSIYDARNTLFAAYRTLYRQWALVFEIGAVNRARGFRPAAIRTVCREWLRTNADIRTYPPAD